jgi:hypothetical protein
MRVATDWAATMRPAPTRTLASSPATVKSLEITSFDREIVPYLLALTLAGALAFETQASLAAGGGPQELVAPAVLALTGFICLVVYRNWNNSL